MKRGESGFGLLEAILAIALLSIFAVGISIAFSTLGEASIEVTAESNMVTDVEALIMEAGFSGRLVEFDETVKADGGWTYKITVEEADGFTNEDGVELGDLFNVRVEAKPPNERESAPLIAETLIYRPVYER